MTGDERFNTAIAQIDAANAEDPRTEMVDGRAQPRELLFGQRVYEWVQRLVQDPSAELLLAARAHNLYVSRRAGSTFGTGQGAAPRLPADSSTTSLANPPGCS